MSEPLLNEDIHAYLDRHQRKELLRFLTCGSVDDGKSTLIGRLLHDTKGIYEDQLAAVKKDSVKHGTTGEGQIDLALLTDGLRAEREQGITIDVAYRYFSTDKRKFIIADTPGHEQYTRNMATGASTCALAIILIDARYGVQVQTRRHTYICALLGIRHLVIAINKMDLVGYSQARFEEIRREYLAFSAKLEFGDVAFIPLSALKGDNVVQKSEAMPWYDGPTVLGHLESVPLEGDRNLAELRLPVQLVLRPNLNFRGFAGTIASGVIRKGERVMALPSGKTSRVKSIVTFDGELTEAYAPMAVTVTLEEEIDVSRGDLLVDAAGGRAGKLPETGNQVEAMVVWMNEQPLVPGKSYWFKQATRVVTGAVREIVQGVDVNTLEERAASTLALNEVGRVVLSLSSALVFDPYRENHATGAFIVIDRLSNTTVGAGMILGKAVARGGGSKGRVSEEEKEVRLGQRGAVVWAEPGVADGLERALFEEGRTVVRLDVGEAEAGRAGLGALVRSLAEQGVIVVAASATAPGAALSAALGRRLVMAEGDGAAAVRRLQEEGVAAAEEAVGGDEI